MIKSLMLTRYSNFDDAIIRRDILNPTSFVRVKNIQGLGPVKADVSRAPSATQPGGFLLGSRIPERNIILTLEMTTGYQDDYSLSDVRRNLTTLLDPGSRIEMIFELDDISVSIEGTVESHEPEMFTDMPMAVVSIICEHPFFKNVAPPVVFNVPSTNVFEFKYVGRQLAPVGFEFRGVLQPTTVGPNAAYPRLTQEGSLRGLLGVPDYGFEAYDTIIFDTRRGQRSVKRIRDSATNDILGFFQGSLMDFNVLPGLNIWRWNKITTGTKVTYTPEYTSI